jgi:hypothetical protein
MKKTTTLLAVPPWLCRDGRAAATKTVDHKAKHEGCRDEADAGKAERACRIVLPGCMRGILVFTRKGAADGGL